MVRLLSLNSEKSLQQLLTLHRILKKLLVPLPRGGGEALELEVLERHQLLRLVNLRISTVCRTLVEHLPAVDRPPVGRGGEHLSDISCKNKKLD